MDNKHKIIGQYLTTRGFVVVGPLLTPEFCESAIGEIVTMFRRQPRVPGRELILDKLTGLTRKEVTELKKRWVPHVTFGAPCESPAFHLNHAWAVRQSPSVYNIFRHLHKTDDICVSIDRFKAKLPGTGEREFCHWDSDPRAWKFGQEDLNLQGIVALTDIEFVCVPETHTQKFQEEFLPLYPYVGGKALNQIDPTRDPLKLSQREQKIKVKAGNMIIWNDKLLHSSYPNKTKDIKFAYYITYDRKENIKQPKEDRIRSYLTGTCPKLFPSGGKACYMPPAWIRFPQHARRYHERLPEHLREFRNSNGKQYPIITEKTPDWYVPPTLTPLGLKLLGLDEGETLPTF